MLVLFVITIIPLIYILRKCTGSYKFIKLQKKIQHLMYMDNIKRRPRYKIEFRSENCAMMIMKSGERKTTEGIKLPKKENIRTLGDKEN